MPDATIEAFRDHGKVARTVDADLDAARAALADGRGRRHLDGRRRRDARATRASPPSPTATPRCCARSSRSVPGADPRGSSRTEAIALDDLVGGPAHRARRSRGTRRDALFGRTVTYSPKVFIPLTELCRDRCGYCTFAKAPAHLAAPYLLDRRGRRASPGEARRRAAPRRSSRSASVPSCATPTRRRGWRPTGTPRRSTTSPPRARPSSQQTSLAAPRQRRCALARRARRAAPGRGEPGDDARVAARRPRRAPPRARQDPGAAPRDPRVRRRAVDPVHDGRAHRHRRGPRGPARRARRRSPRPTSATATSRR